MREGQLIEVWHSWMQLHEGKLLSLASAHLTSLQIMYL